LPEKIGWGMLEIASESVSIAAPLQKDTKQTTVQRWIDCCPCLL